MTNKDLLKLNEQVIDAWNRHDVDKFLELCDDKITWKDIANEEPYQGKQGAREFSESWLKGFPDLKIKIKNVVNNEDTIAVEATFTGTNTGPLKVGPEVPEISPTLKAISNNGVYFAKVKNNRF